MKYLLFVILLPACCPMGGHALTLQRNVLDTVEYCK